MLEELTYAQDSAFYSSLNGADTLLIKLITESNEVSTFFRMENPLWYILTLIMGALITYLLTLNQGKKEAVTEAKKVMLQRRIEVHEELNRIMSRGLLIHSQKDDGELLGIFQTRSFMNSWFNELMILANDNKVYLFDKVNVEMNKLNNLRKYIDYLVEVNSWSDIELQNYARKYYKEITSLFKITENAIHSFLMGELSLKFKFVPLTNNELQRCQKELFKYKMISDFFTRGDIIS